MILKDSLIQKGIHFGCAVNTKLLESDKDYANFIKDQFNMVTPENAMKFWALHELENKFDFTQADSLVEFALKNDLLVRGHTLVFNKNIPDWVKKYSTKDALQKIFDEHILTVTEHFSGQIYCWDVINEAFDHHGQIDRESFWQQHLGDEYVAHAFKLAHQADPNARLFLNEWGMEPLNKRSDAVYKFVQQALINNVPIHGIGIQMHIAFGRNKFLEDIPDLESLYQNLKRFSDLGLEIHITEMDISIQSHLGSAEEKLADQTKLFKDIFSVCQRVPNLKAIVQWGASDKQSWIPSYTGQPDSPLLFDNNYRQKFEFI